MPPGVMIEWFIGAETNVCYNALDRHISEGRGGKTALIWEGNEPGQQATFTFDELHAEASAFGPTRRSSTSVLVGSNVAVRICRSVPAINHWGVMGAI